MALTSEDREALVAAKRRSPNSHWIVVAVEQIVARHVTEARAAAWFEGVRVGHEEMRLVYEHDEDAEGSTPNPYLATTSPPARTRP